MSNKKFSSNEAIQFGWEVMKKHFIFFLGLVAVSSVFGLESMYRSHFGQNTSTDYSVYWPLFSLVGLIMGIIRILINMGVINISIKFAKKEHPTYADLMTTVEKFLNFFIASILYGLLVFVGMILLIVPGIYWAIKYQYYGYLIIDKNLGAIDALKKSAELTDGVKGDLLGFGVVLGLVNLVGLLVLGIGLLATIPTAWVAQAYVYHKLASHKN